MISIEYQGNGNTLSLNSTPNLVLVGYEGLDQPLSETITLSNPNLIGSQYQRSQILDRTISFTFNVYNVEQTRYTIMNVFKSGDKGILVLKNDIREGQIDCYVEEVTFSRFDNPTLCTIFLRAPYPYFKGLEDIVEELDNATSLFVLEAYIPEEGIILGEINSNHTATINNDSEQLGIEISFVAIGNVVNPIIYNTTSNKFIGLNYTLINGMKLNINTSTGNKKVEIEIDGLKTNVINYLMRGSSFFQLERGENILTSNAASGGEDMMVSIKYRDEYEAI